MLMLTESHLCVSVTELITKSAHRASNPDGRRVDTKLNDVIKRRVRGRREVEEGICATDGVLAGLQVLVLPDPPCAIDLRVVQEEVGVTRRGVEVTTWKRS